MRAFLEEYGKAITTVVFAILIFALSVPLLFNLTDTLYPRESIQEVDMDIDAAVYNQPVILVDSGLRIPYGDQNYNGKAAAGNASSIAKVKQNFAKFAKVYERSHSSAPYVNESERIDDRLEIFGVETVDTTKKGVYRLAYYVKNNTGHSFLCNVSVVVS